MAAALNEDARVESIADQSLASVTRAIASRAPAPGSGVAAAATLALGIACASKAAAITLKHDPKLPDVELGNTRLAALQVAALRHADTDACCFPAATRHDRHAAELLVENDLTLLACAHEAEAIVMQLAGRVNEAMRNDILAAQSLIAAAATIVRANLSENAAAQSSGNSRSEADR